MQGGITESISDFGEELNTLSNKGNYYSVDPSNRVEDLQLSKFWFANINKDLKDKRSKEEQLIVMNEWSTAKQRVAEEVACKNERIMLVSDPSRIAILKEQKKLQNGKIYKSQDSFLNSHESSLNTTIKTEGELVVDDQSLQKPVDGEHIEEVDEDKEADNSIIQNSDEQNTLENGTLTIDKGDSIRKRKGSMIDKNQNMVKRGELIDLTKPRPLDETIDETEKFGQNIKGVQILDPKQEESEYEESDNENNKKKEQLMNYASIAGINKKKSNILRIRQMRGELINAGQTMPADQVSNVFNCQSKPDHLTMSVYSRPFTTQNVKITGLYPQQTPIGVFSTKDRKMKNKKSINDIDLFNYNIENNTPFRPKTVGYSFSPQREFYSKTQVMIEDRNMHIEGSRQEQIQEIRSIANFLARQSITSTDENKKFSMSVPFSITALQKAILLPGDDEVLKKKEHPNPALYQLMENPIASKAKKGKKGKKK